MNKAIFLDKDGTLVDNSLYPKQIPKDKLLREDILNGLKYAQNKGYKLIIISNQPWISKKQMTKEEVEKVFYNVMQELKKEGIIIEDYYYCPHQTSDNCACKKPKNALIVKAEKEHNIDLSKSFIVGDMEQDILAGKSSGIKTILVLTGNGREFENMTKADFKIKNLNEIYKAI